jgi:hypothetical protein
MLIKHEGFFGYAVYVGSGWPGITITLEMIGARGVQDADYYIRSSRSSYVADSIRSFCRLYRIGLLPKVDYQQNNEEQAEQY